MSRTEKQYEKYRAAIWIGFLFTTSFMLKFKFDAVSIGLGWMRLGIMPLAFFSCIISIRDIAENSILSCVKTYIVIIVPNLILMGIFVCNELFMAGNSSVNYGQIDHLHLITKLCIWLIIWTWCVSMIVVYNIVELAIKCIASIVFLICADGLFAKLVGPITIWNRCALSLEIVSTITILFGILIYTWFKLKRNYVGM